MSFPLWPLPAGLWLSTIDSRPAGGAKCQPVVHGQVSGKEKPEKLRLTTNFWSKNELALASPCGGGDL